MSNLMIRSPFTYGVFWQLKSIRFLSYIGMPSFFICLLVLGFMTLSIENKISLLSRHLIDMGFDKRDSSNVTFYV